MSKEITVKGTYDINAPAQMTKMAKVLKGHVVSHKLYTNIRGKNYAHVEGWQFAGGLMGLYPRVVKVENIGGDKMVKWLAEVEIVNTKTGDVVSRGFALCSKSEAKKSSFDEYAILSMAQTRAIGKAYRNLIGWVMKLAGYEATPSEEMFKVGETAPATPKNTAAKKTAPVKPTGYECHGCAAVIDKATHDYSKRLYKRPLCRSCQKSSKK